MSAEATARYWAPSTKEGWRRIVDQVVPSPPRLTIDALDKLSDNDRAEHTRARLAFMTEAAVVETPQLRTILTEARKRIYLNEHKSYARNGLMISGEPTLGKTTTVIRVGRDHERRRRAQTGALEDDGMIPVVYVTVPPTCGSKDMLIQFADFFGLPHGPRVSRTEMMSMISTVMREVRTELVIVDEIHNLDLGRQPSAEASDALKQLSEKCNATFIYAGINLESSGLFTGIRGQQIAGRFALHHLTPFTTSSKEARALWDAVLSAFEGSLCLAAQPSGAILAFAEPLLHYTGGSIGKLADVLRMMALDAMHSGSERLTPELMREYGVGAASGIRGTKSSVPVA